MEGERPCPFCPGEKLAAVIRAGATSYLNSRLAGLGLAYGLPGSPENDVAACPRCGFLAMFHRPASAQARPGLSESIG